MLTFRSGIILGAVVGLWFMAVDSFLKDLFLSVQSAIIGLLLLTIWLHQYALYPTNQREAENEQDSADAEDRSDVR